VIRIKIGIEERHLAMAEPQWIVRAIRGERDNHGYARVQIRFDLEGIHLVLATPGGPGGPGRPISCFNREEQRLIKYWKELGLFDNERFSPDTIVEFVNSIGRKYGIAA